MTEEYKSEVIEILENLGQQLDISESQYNEAVKSYEAVGEWLSKEGSPLYPYNPRILPQGSFMLGTIIKPINDEDDIDIERDDEPEQDIEQAQEVKDNNSPSTSKTSLSYKRYATAKKTRHGTFDIQNVSSKTIHTVLALHI